MFIQIYRLFQVLNRWKSKYFFAAFLLILSFVMLSLEPRILQFAVDRVVAFYYQGNAIASPPNDLISQTLESLLPGLSENAPWIVLLGLAGIYVLLASLRGTLTLVASAQSAGATEGALKEMRDGLFRHIQRLPLSFFTTMSRGELIQRSTGDLVTVGNFLGTQVVEVVRLTAIFGFSVVMMLILDPLYTFWAVCLTPIALILSLIFFQKERVVWEAHEKESDLLNAKIQENLNGIRVVKALSEEEGEKVRFDEQNRRKLAVALRHVRLHSFFWPATDILIGIQMIIVILYGGYRTFSGQLSIGELMSFYSYALLTTWPMRHIGQTLSQMGMAVVAMERLHEVLSSPEENLDGDFPDAPVVGEIEFRKVTFSYHPGETPNILENLSFRIRPGEIVALVGPTGSGKSTIINLLLGLYEPQSGEILIDGRFIHTYSRRYLREQIGVVLQTPFLFSTTIRENVAYTANDPENTDIDWATAVAQADRLREVLEDGFDTVVGEKGVTLSGGQKQRVALARTLLKAAPVLVLDDVTSAVDTGTEQAIFRGLADFLYGKTTILISHRITSLQPAGRLLVLGDGRIVQDGSPEALQRVP
ncbi:MAG TPA: ABC transporter ATP-binding protein, partial [Calditrichia bacterium]|nr:ABC transporter ATP-binding protein [Calditrichia bacterium]